MATSAQLAQYCADHFPVAKVATHSLFSGVSHLMYEVIGGIAAFASGFGLGWYIKGRGMTGVQIDLNNIKNDVENLKNKVFPVSAPVVSTPVA